MIKISNALLFLKKKNFLRKCIDVEKRHGYRVRILLIHIYPVVYFVKYFWHNLNIKQPSKRILKHRLMFEVLTYFIIRRFKMNS